MGFFYLGGEIFFLKGGVCVGGVVVVPILEKKTKSLS